MVCAASVARVSSKFMRNRFFLALTVVLLLTAAVSLPAADDGTLTNATSLTGPRRMPSQDATSQGATLPIDQIQPGMKGVAYTIFSGDTVEPMDLTVIGVLHNALGPKVDVILVQLLGEKPEHSGVVAGMSGSPVFINGKLAGALSLKLGMFTKEAIGGVTPIANMYDINNALPADGTANYRLLLRTELRRIRAQPCIEPRRDRNGRRCLLDFLRREFQFRPNLRDARRLMPAATWCRLKRR